MTKPLLIFFAALGTQVERPSCTAPLGPLIWGVSDLAKFFTFSDLSF